MISIWLLRIHQQYSHVHNWLEGTTSTKRWSDRVNIIRLHILLRYYVITSCIMTSYNWCRLLSYSHYIVKISINKQWLDKNTFCLSRSKIETVGTCTFRASDGLEVRCRLEQRSSAVPVALKAKGLLIFKTLIYLCICDKKNLEKVLLPSQTFCLLKIVKYIHVLLPICHFLLCVLKNFQDENIAYKDREKKSEPVFLEQVVRNRDYDLSWWSWRSKNLAKLNGSGFIQFFRKWGQTQF